MYPTGTLYQAYKKRQLDSAFSRDLPDITKKITLERINAAINLCDNWGTFLDIGGGSGHYSTALSAVFENGTLIEIEKNREHSALVETYPNISIFNDLIENYSGEVCDFILLADVFEHMVDIQAFTKKLGQLQTIGGVVYVMTPNPQFCGPANRSELFHTKTKFGHIKHYSRPEIIQLMKRVGYEEVFYLHEEAPFRQKIKRLVKGISRRDQRLRDIPILKYIRLITVPVTKIIFGLLEGITYKSEIHHQNDEFETMTQDMAFKKVS